MITSARIADIPPFTYPAIEFEFDEQVNLFIGPNASGKSTILRQLANKRLDTKFNFGFGGRRDPEYILGMQRHEDTYLRREQHEHLESLKNSRQHAQLMPWVVIPPVRMSMPSSHRITKWLGELPTNVPNGVDQLFKHQKEHQYIFDSKVFYIAVEEINQQFLTGRGDDSKFGNALKTKDLPYKCAQDICRDVLIENAQDDYIQDSEWADPDPIVHFDMGVGTIDLKDRAGEVLFLGNLSSGTQGTLLWIWFMAISMAAFYDFCDGWEEQPAVLLIDEIENHLHPTWQRRVIPALRKHFPGVQIFATTHSPFVVAGLKAGQVHLLERDENGVVSASTHDRDIVGWTIEQILHSVMGVNALTDEDTANKAARLRELQRKDALDGLSEGEAAEMEDLRANVSRDILAGGALNAQLDRYDDMMREFLKSRLSETAQDKASD